MLVRLNHNAVSALKMQSGSQIAPGQGAGAYVQHNAVFLRVT